MKFVLMKQDILILKCLCTILIEYGDNFSDTFGSLWQKEKKEMK